jgi:hypothetical protein
MGRNRLWTEDMQSRFAPGTFAEIESVLEEGESRTDFVREAVDMLILHRKEAREKKRATKKTRP